MNNIKNSRHRYIASKIILATIVYFALVFMSQPFIPEIVYYNILGFSILCLLFVLSIKLFKTLLYWFEDKTKSRSSSDEYKSRPSNRG